MYKIKEQVTRLFIAVDECDWDTVRECFADEVELDYSSMNGQPAAVLKADDIIEGWKQVPPGFTHTHHQIGNVIATSSDQEGSLFCYGTASHYLENKKGNVWTVVGSYDIDLKFIDGNWKITKHKFNFKYQDGNGDLPNMAMEAK